MRISVAKSAHRKAFDPYRFNASSLGRSERVVPVIRASSDSLGRAKNAVLTYGGCAPLPACDQVGSYCLVAGIGTAVRRCVLKEAGVFAGGINMAPSLTQRTIWRDLLSSMYSVDGPGVVGSVFCVE